MELGGGRRKGLELGTFVGNTITRAHGSVPGFTMISPSSSWWSA